jgi:hypothetical protein
MVAESGPALHFGSVSHLSLGKHEDNPTEGEITIWFLSYHVTCWLYTKPFLKPMFKVGGAFPGSLVASLSVQSEVGLALILQECRLCFWTHTFDIKEWVWAADSARTVSSGELPRHHRIHSPHGPFCSLLKVQHSLIIMPFICLFKCPEFQWPIWLPRLI